MFALQISHFKIPRALDFFLGNTVFAICVSNLPPQEITDFLRRKFTSRFSKITHFHVFGQMSDF